MEIYDIKTSGILNLVSSNILGQMKYIKEDIGGINEDIKDVKGNIKEGTESIKEVVKDAKKDIIESIKEVMEENTKNKETPTQMTECCKRKGMENIERGIPPNSGVAVLGELYLVGFCFTLTFFDECK